MKGLALSAAACVLGLAGAAPAWSQAATPGAVPAATPKAVPTATPEKLALAKAIMEANGGAAQAASVMKTMIGATFQGMQQTIPPAQARLISGIQADLEAEMVGVAPAIVQISEQLYAQDFTEKELRDELAWVTSDSGRAIHQKTPLLTQQLIQAEVPMIQAMMPAMTQRVVDRVCAEMQCSAQDRQVIAAAMARSVAARPS